MYLVEGARCGCAPRAGEPVASTNWSKRKEVSEGPHLASGWNCAENHGIDVCMMPSFESSFRLVKSGTHPLGSASASRA